MHSRSQKSLVLPSHAMIFRLRFPDRAKAGLYSPAVKPFGNKKSPQYVTAPCTIADAKNRLRPPPGPPIEKSRNGCQQHVSPIRKTAVRDVRKSEQPDANTRQPDRVHRSAQMHFFRQTAKKDLPAPRRKIKFPRLAPASVFQCAQCSSKRLITIRFTPSVSDARKRQQARQNRERTISRPAKRNNDPPSPPQQQNPRSSNSREHYVKMYEKTFRPGRPDSPRTAQTYRPPQTPANTNKSAKPQPPLLSQCSNASGQNQGTPLPLPIQKNESVPVSRSAYRRNQKQRHTVQTSRPQAPAEVTRSTTPTRSNESIANSMELRQTTLQTTTAVKSTHNQTPWRTKSIPKRTHITKTPSMGIGRFGRRRSSEIVH